MVCSESPSTAAANANISSSFHDPSAAIPTTPNSPLVRVPVLSNTTVVIEWAPGVSETLNLPAGVSAFDFSYVYNAAGVYSVMVTVMDKDGGQQQQNFTVEVASAGEHLYLPLVTR